MSYRFVEEEKKEPIVWPKRVQILVDDYLSQGKKVNKNIRLDYSYETIDYLEKIFEDRVRDKPNTLKVSVSAVYRVRVLTGEEYYYYAAFKTCNNKLGQLVEPFSYEHYGYHKSPVVRLQWNEMRAKNEPKVAGYQQCFEQPWNKEEVRKLLDGSYIPCMSFYIGRAGQSANEPIEDHRYQIFNIQDFIEGTFDDVYDLGRLGISYKEPSLHLVEAARKQERENREKAVGLKDPKVYG